MGARKRGREREGGREREREGGGERERESKPISKDTTLHVINTAVTVQQQLDAGKSASES